MPPDLPDELPEGYYLENFEYLINFVQSRYHQLLTEEERAFSTRFFSLSDDAKRLYVRLTNRKGIYFRVDKLRYEEIGDHQSAIAELGRHDFLDEAPEIDMADVIGLITKDEILCLDICSNVKKSQRRDELEALVLEEPECDPVVELGLQIVEVGELASLQVHRLLFFGNFHQDMTEFVLHELVSPFESYTLSPDFSLFRNRETLDEAVLLHELGELSHEVIVEDDTGSMILDFLDDLPERNTEPLLARRFDRIVNRLGRQLERLGVAEEALNAYGRSQATPSRERRARLLEKEARAVDALDMCREIIASPLDEEEMEFAVKFGHRIAKKHKQQSDDLPALRGHKIPEEMIRVAREYDSVEPCALNFYLGKGYKGYYVENALFRTMFGLTFWDIIFAPVKGVFFNPFQRGPLDLYTPEFRRARAGLIAQRFEALSSAEALANIVLRHVKAKEGIANDFVSWGLVDEEFLSLALTHIPVHDYLAVFDRMLLDLKNNTNGLPDLVLFDDDSYTLVEIKGPGDRLQKNQTRWFHFFLDHEIPAFVANVEYED